MMIGVVLSLLCARAPRAPCSPCSVTELPERRALFCQAQSTQAASGDWLGAARVRSGMLVARDNDADNFEIIVHEKVVSSKVAIRKAERAVHGTAIAVQRYKMLEENGDCDCNNSS